MMYLGIELDAKYVEIAENKLAEEIGDSKLGDTWVSFFLRKVVTLRNIDRDIVAPYFIIPEDRKQIDVTEIELNKDIDEIRNMRHTSRRKAMKMQGTPKEILTKARLNALGTAFADCVKELFNDTLPQAKITIYMATPKYDDKGNMSSAFRYVISDDTVDDETLKERMDLRHEPLLQCFLDKLSHNKDRDPDSNWVRYFGQVLTLGDEQPSMGPKPIEGLTFDESQWIEVIKFAQRRNWYSKIEIIRGVVIQTIIQISVREIWELLKASLSEINESGDDTVSKLMEKIKDLPLAEILEEIRRHFPGLFL